jgi:hypothetical protein
LTAITLDSLDPGDIVDRKRVGDTPEGAKMEWQLVIQDDLTTLWMPRTINPDKSITENSWMPLPGSQFVFLSCPIYEALYEGTRGPGKTLTLLMDFAKDVGKGYGKTWRGILFRREYKDLDDVVKKIEEWFPLMFGEKGFRFLKSKSEYMVIWPTGEALLLRHLEKVEDYDNYHGHEYPWLGFEELTQWEDDAPYLKMQSCCRSGKPGVPCRVRSTTNPFGVGHNWVKRRFQLPHMRGKTVMRPNEMPRVAIHGSLYENFLLLHANPHYVTQLMQSTKNPMEAKAWVEGDWNVTAGGMIDDLWNPDIHVVPNIPAAAIPLGWTITRAYDHGQSHPFAVGWWLESNGEPIEMPDGRLIGRIRGDIILWREWYGTDSKSDGSENTNIGLRWAARKIAEGIKDREEDEGVWGRVTPGPADTEIYNQQSDRNGRCPGDDMEEVGVFWERANKIKGSRKRGWELLRTRLGDAYPNPDGSREEPGFFVCQRCLYWILLCPPMPRDTDDPDEVPKNYEDHMADMTRYRLNWEVPGMWRKSF